MERNHKLSNLAIMLKRKKWTIWEKIILQNKKSDVFFSSHQKEKTRGENIKMYLKSKKVSPSWHSNFLFLFTNYLMIDLYVIVINCVSNVFFTNIISILPKIIKVNKTEVLSPNIRTQQSHRQKVY